MIERLCSLVENHPNLHAFLRPFIDSSTKMISKTNILVDSYIYDSDNPISDNNFMIEAQLEYSPPFFEKAKRI